MNISDVKGNFYETNPIANRIYFVTQNGLFNCEDKNADIQLCTFFPQKDVSIVKAVVNGTLSFKSKGIKKDHACNINAAAYYAPNCKTWLFP